MGKQQVTMTIDSEIAEQFQRLFPNERSSYCNEMMRLRVSSTKGDISGLKLDLLLHKEQELKDKIAILNSELVGISEQIRLVKDNQNKAKELKLKEEQAKLEAMKTCSGCGRKVVEPHIKDNETIDGSQFCRECFFNEHPKIKPSLKNR